MNARLLSRLLLSLSLCLCLIVSPLPAIDLVWDDEGNSADKTWTNNGNWNPDNLPDDTDDLFIGVNTFGLGTVNGTNDSTVLNANIRVNSVTLGNGADITNSADGGTTTHELQIDSGLTLGSSGGTSTVRLHDAPSNVRESLDANTITINSGGQITLDSSGSLGSQRAIVQADAGLFDINAGGTLFGSGVVELEQALASPTTLMSVDGTLSAGYAGGGIVLLPPASLLQITAADANARLDLDGTGGGSTVNVFRNATLDIDVRIGDGAFNDAFNGTMNFSSNATLDIEDAWLFSGTMNVNTPGLLLGTAGGAAKIAGGKMTMQGGSITVDTGGIDSLRFSAEFESTGGTINNSGTVIFDADATIGSGSSFLMQGNDASLTVGDGASVTVNDANFDLDANGLSTNVTTIGAGSTLDLNLGVGADEKFDGTINVNSGNLSVTTDSNEWTIDRQVTLSNAGGSSARLSGNRLNVGNDAGTLDADLNVTGTGVSSINSPVVFNSDADVTIAAGATLQTNNATFTPVNGGNNAGFSGAGTWRLAGTNTFEEATTLNMVGGTVDLDNSSTLFALFANDTFVNAPLIINAATLADYGRSLPGSPPIIQPSRSELNVDSTAGNNGILTVNLDSPDDAWTINSVGVVNLINDNAAAILLAGSDVNLQGTMNITGDVRSNARLDIGGTINIETAGQFFRLAGGDGLDENTIAGGTINGPGAISADTGTALIGHGTINADIDFNGTASLYARGGLLRINGAILDVSTLGTADATGDITSSNPWNTNTTNAVVLNGGTLFGDPVTNDGVNGIRGEGRVTARLINNTQVEAIKGDLQLFNATNDWDGTTNTGSLRAILGELELVDTANFSFFGNVTAEQGSVFANGFGLQFQVGSSLDLIRGEYRSTDGTIFSGSINVQAGGDSTISIPAGYFFTSSNTTTLDSNLRLEDGFARIDSGAIFGGGSAVVNTTSNSLALADGANVGVLVQNEGQVTLASAGIAQATVLDYKQTSTGSLEIELEGTGLADFDRLTATGLAQLDGELELSLLGGFAPSLGDSFTILSAAAGVSGAFSSLDFGSATLDPGLIWDVVYNLTNVQLVVAEEATLLPGDYNDDGTVDAADYTVWRDNLGSTNVLPGDETPGMVTAADYDVWKANFGSMAASLAASASLSVSAAAVPEPSTVLVMLVSLALVVCGRRSRMAS